MMKDNLSPVVLFVFSRPDHTRRTLDALRANTLASQTDLIVYADAARTEQENRRVEEVRGIVKSISGFRSVTVIERSENFGLANNIIDGVTDACQRFGRVIVLEDDLVTSPYFLAYMNEALELYEDDQQVASIHGYCYPVNTKLPETFFLKGADCWGWATWKRAWQHFNPDGKSLLHEIKSRNLSKEFDYHGAYSFTNMLKAQIARKNNSWAIRWHASAFLKEMLTLYPGESLVKNIGFDLSGTHCSDDNRFDTNILNRKILLKKIQIRQSETGITEFEKYFRSLKPRFSRRVVNKIKNLAGKIWNGESKK